MRTMKRIGRDIVSFKLPRKPPICRYLTFDSYSAVRTPDEAKDAHIPRGLSHANGFARSCIGFGWANGMFGQMILQLERERPALLGESYQ